MKGYFQGSFFEPEKVCCSPSGKEEALKARAEKRKEALIKARSAKGLKRVEKIAKKRFLKEVRAHGTYIVAYKGCRHPHCTLFHNTDIADE